MPQPPDQHVRHWRAYNAALAILDTIHDRSAFGPRYHASEHRAAPYHGWPL